MFELERSIAYGGRANPKFVIVERRPGSKIWWPTDNAFDTEFEALIKLDDIENVERILDAYEIRQAWSEYLTDAPRHEMSHCLDYPDVVE